jgi:dimethylglycine dehydrogenase
VKTETKVVVIGGGVVGCSVLYHLVKAGWTDSVLVERKELTSGSSWHAAGGLTALTASANASRLQKYAQDLYPVLEKESGQNVGFHRTGGITLAGSTEEYETLKVTRARGIRVGIDAQFIFFEEARRLSPVLNTDGLHAVLYDPCKGHVDPASATHAFAKAARDLGAEIYRQTTVIETIQEPAGGWIVVTDCGAIKSQFVVNASGLWAREVGRLAGIELPLMPVEHHYLVTEAIPEILAMGPHKRLCTMAENEDGFYSPQEGLGILVGAYENKCTHWAVDGTPADFDTELLPDDLDRISKNYEKAIRRMPCLETAGIKTVINGPMIFSPDLAPLIGPHPDLKNYFCAVGVMTAFNQGAGVGRLLAEWLVDGEPSIDIHGWDVARYGKWATGRFTFERTKFFYENRYTRIYPHQEFGPGRDIRHFDVYEDQKAAGGVFGQNYGWETPLWYARAGEIPEDRYSYRRGNWHEAVGEEARTVRENAGLFEVSTFAKYLVSGPNAWTWLDRLLTNTVPIRIGKTVLSPMLSEKGRIIGDFTVTRLDNDKFMLLGAGFMQEVHKRWFNANREVGADFKNISLDYAGMHIAGPKSRDVLAQLTNVDVSNSSFPFLSGRKMALAGVADCLVFRVSFSGELGYEIYAPMASHRALFRKIVAAGKPFGLRLCGSRALTSLRLEKGYASWGADIGPDYSPWDAELGQFVRLSKPFIGRDAAEKSKTQSEWKRLLASVHAGSLDAAGGEPVFRNREYVGYVSSGGYGHTTGKSIAMCYLRRDALGKAEDFTIEILGNRYPISIQEQPLVDPEGRRQRA